MTREIDDDILWEVQDHITMNPYVKCGVTVHEFPPDTGYADFLLFAYRFADRVAEGKVYGRKVMKDQGR